MAIDLMRLLGDERAYVLHSHTQFCDGHAPMDAMAAAAAEEGMRFYGFTPHSPICVDSPCNMSRDDVEPYFREAERLRELYSPQMSVLTSMEIDYISEDFGPHIDYFQRLPLDYRLASVHFVPTREGFAVDCDGSYERFARNLKDAYGGDLRYVVEKFYEQELRMLERGGFDMLGHFDKIAGNASMANPAIEEEPWYEALIDDVISHAQTAGVVIEINTKALADRKRFYPERRWWRKILDAGLPIVVNSDAHDPAKISVGRREAFEIIDSLRNNQTVKPE